MLAYPESVVFCNCLNTSSRYETQWQKSSFSSWQAVNGKPRETEFHLCACGNTLACTALSWSGRALKDSCSADTPRKQQPHLLHRYVFILCLDSSLVTAKNIFLIGLLIPGPLCQLLKGALLKQTKLCHSVATPLAP